MNKRRDQNNFTEQARRVLEIEARAVQDLIPRLDSRFAQACELCLACAGHVGGKIAATLASTGTPAFFVHPGEASHGDVGMITPKDLVVAVSNSGETAEIVTLLPLLKRMGVELITLTGKSDSTLAEAATVNLDIAVDEEACPLNLSPTASTTAALAMGDALAVALLESRGFTREDFARSHPGGTLGRRLLLLVGDLMHTGEEVPKVAADTLLADGLIEMTAKGLGITAIVDASGNLEGVYTDGDLRRTLDNPVDVHATTMREVMTKNPKTVNPKLLAAEAVRLLEQHQITSLIVVDDDSSVVGALNVHDLFRAGVM
jgi:arabinose-5-phosphate isomerase